MELAAVTARILDLARRRFGLGADALAPKDDLLGALGIDSVQALELLSALEAELGVELPDWELQDVRTFDDLARRVQDRL